MPDLKPKHAPVYGLMLLLLSAVFGIKSASGATASHTEIGPQTSTLRSEYATVSKPEYAAGVQSLEWRSDPASARAAVPDDDTTPIVSEADVWQRIRSGFRFSDIQNPLTAEHEAWYAAHPDYVKRMVERSRRYLFHIVSEVERRGMPMEIALLPMIESAFNPKAYSTSAASGIWQFIASTGRNYGLKQNHWYDGRRDIPAATNAALDYLQKLYTDFGDWQLALAAYNCGEGCVSRAIRKNIQLGLATDYTSLTLSSETRHYVPKLLAVKHLVMDPQRFGVALDVLPNQPYFAQVEMNASMDVRSAARLAGMEMADFTSLNPAFSQNLIRSDTTIHILVPVDKADRFQHNLIHGSWDTWTPYYAKKGEQLQALASRFDTSIERLKEHNSFILKRGKLAHGQTILVPVKGRAVTQGSAPVVAPAAEAQPAQSSGMYTVVAGDTLFSIARQYQLSLDTLKLANPALESTVKIGQVLAIPPNAAGTSAPETLSAQPTPPKKVAINSRIRTKRHPRYYTIKRGDTLNAVARQFDVELSDLRSWNPQLDRAGIHAGKRIVVGMK